MNSPETPTDGRPQEYQNKNNKLMPPGPSVTTSCPSTLLPDDPERIKDVAERPPRPDEFPVSEVPRRKPEELIVRDKLGLSDKWWDETKRLLCEQYGELMAMDLKIPRVLVTHEIFSYDFLDRAQRQCVQMAENDALSAQDRLDAAEMLGYLADIATKKAKQLIELGEKAGRKTVDAKKRNLPPNATLVQVNVGNTSEQTKATHPLPTARVEGKQVKMGAG